MQNEPKISIKWEPLDPTKMMTQVAMPPFISMGLCGASLFLLNPIRDLLQVLFDEKEAGLEKQYLLTGVSYFELYASRYVHQLLNLTIVFFTLPILLTYANPNSDLGLILVPQALAILVIPLNIIFLYSVFKNYNARKVVENFMLFIQITTFILPVGCVFAGVAGEPSSVSISFLIEAICCLHPINAVTFIWIKQSFRGWYAINSPFSTSTDLMSINGCLLEVIGLSANLIILPILIYTRETQKLKMQNDGVIAQ